MLEGTVTKYLAVELAEFLNKTGRQPEQVQDFYPTPGTLSTCMWYTGIDPRTMEEVYVSRDPHEKALQRALLQWKRPEKRRLIMEALHKADRADLIGYGPHCLLRPSRPAKGEGTTKPPSQSRQGKAPSRGAAPPHKKGKSPSRTGRGTGKKHR